MYRKRIPQVGQCSLDLPSRAQGGNERYVLVKSVVISAYPGWGRANKAYRYGILKGPGNLGETVARKGVDDPRSGVREGRSIKYSFGSEEQKEARRGPFKHRKSLQNQTTGEEKILGKPQDWCVGEGSRL